MILKTNNEIIVIGRDQYDKGYSNRDVVLTYYNSF